MAGRDLALTFGASDIVVQKRVVSYCLSCRKVLDPANEIDLFVSVQQAQFDIAKATRGPLVSQTGDWKSLGLHDWHALKQYGIHPVKIRRNVVEFSAEDRRNWMTQRLGLDATGRRRITDVFGESVIINTRIVEKIVNKPDGADRTPYVPYAALPLSLSIEVWENDQNEKNEMRRYYLTPHTGEDPDRAGLAAVTAADNTTGEQVVFNVIPVKAKYANNQRKGKLLFLRYVEESLCHHGCCSDSVNGFANLVKTRGDLKNREQQISALKKGREGLKDEVEALKAQREKLRESLARAEAEAEIADLRQQGNDGK